MRFLRRSLVGIFLMAMTLALLGYAGNMVRGAVSDRMSQEPRSFPQRERVIAANVVDVIPQTISPTLTSFGELRSQRTLDLRSPVGGTVLMADAALTEGGAVTAGQILLEIDPSEAQAAADRASADLQDAEAELRDAQRGLALAQDELAAAEGQVTLRQTAMTRAIDLQTRGVGTAAAVETAELAVSGAQASVLSRRQSLAQAETRLDQTDTRLARARISVTEADRDLADTTVVAAFDGVLSDVTISNGGRITPNERFAQLVDPTQLEVSFRVSTSQYARLLDDAGKLMTASVTVALDISGVNLAATGTITRESAAVGAGQTGRLLFADLQVAPGFRPGDFVTVRITEPELERVALVPATAVAPDNTVLVVGEEDRLEIAQTEVLRRQGDDVIIRVRGLAGRAIVAERSPLLGAGIKINPIRPGQAEESMDEPDAPEMVVLDDERRAKMIAFVTDSRMPDNVKARLLGQLEQEEVSSETVNRLESRMGS
jgi:multidrug efflux pump subunit AcrA (membrane-fusion protein)